NDGVAPSGCASFHRFQEKTIGPVISELEHGGHRRLEIGDEPRPGHLWHALLITAREAGEVRQDGMGRAVLWQGRDGGLRLAHCSSLVPTSLPSAGSLTLTP